MVAVKNKHTLDSALKLSSKCSSRTEFHHNHRRAYNFLKTYHPDVLGALKIGPGTVNTLYFT